ncbi:MAG: polysaccharide biosynthesis protein [Chloroflexi bacterium]|nr:MAG: polysaccharide biosynthesis protein [Chloroflexota bacterium]TMC30658.1 MAG: polysaccharide biosynthesis protein [Chloroflexota bacterium]TMC33338.1 MAG: polysaccharide biosynthesis protein [Chloroflexota bacterium]TME36479.1 MAG: polysaccharide biosynthesis protein [Chloroflexota bacterium]
MKGWTLARIARGIRKHALEGLVDALLVAVCYILVTGVRLGGRIDAPEHTALAAVALGAGAAQVLMNIVLDVYWRDWSVAALEDLVAIVKASAVVALGLFVFDLVGPDHPIPFSAILPGFGLVVLAEGTLKIRPRWRQIAGAAFGARGKEGAIIVGAGRTGALLARDLSDGSRGTRVICFVDDDPRKQGTYVRGARVSGTVDDLRSLIETHTPAVVVIAVSDAPSPLVRRVLAATRNTSVRVRAVGGFRLGPSDRGPLRPIDIDELLQREPVRLDAPETRSFLEGKRVLITGAAGSIGSELVRRVLEVAPSAVSLLDTNESGLHDVVAALPAGAPARLLLGDVRDPSELARAIAESRPDVVFHAAAYKHVPILERSPLPGITTNVLGTARLLAALEDADVDAFVFISSDKAVAPASVLGLTKRFGELLTFAYARAHGRRWSVVRFGNVLGSSGSVVPIFTRQIDAGGPVTVTAPEVTRYFMTIPEAVGLVIRAASAARSGDLLLLDMGEPVRIVDLAKQMIWLRGLRTPEDVAITFTGLRPGEKMHEELWLPDELPVATAHARVLRASARAEVPPLDVLLRVTERVASAVSAGDERSAVALVREAVDARARAAV